MKRALDLVAVVLLASGLIACSATGNQNGKGTGQSTYERVISSGILRCGYVSYPPGFMKDPNTGKASGVFVDIMEASAKNLRLRLEWTEEVGWGSMIEGLQADRYDAICSPVWANSSRARLADFGPPIYYSAIGAYVRKGDKRFQDLSKLNNPGVRIATIDGEMSSIIAASDFPQAQTVSSPQLSDNSQLLLNVASGRADVTFVEPYIAALYLKNQPNAVENIAANSPVRFFPTTIMFRKNEAAFGSMLAVAIQEQINSGALSQAFAKYQVPQNSLLKPALPYRTDNSN